MRQTTTFVLLTMLASACFSPKFITDGMHGQNTEITNQLVHATINTDFQAMPPFGVEGNTLLTTTKKQGIYLDETIIPQITTLPSKVTRKEKTLRESKKWVSSESTPTENKTINKSKEVKLEAQVPRWRYLRNAGLLFVLGLIFVAFSSVEILGILATVAFTGALVYLIIWLVKI